MRDAWNGLRRSFADPGLLRLRSAAVTYVTAVIAALLACIPAVMFDAGISIVVLAVMLSITFTAERAGNRAAQRWISVATLPLVGVAAGAVGLLLVHVPLVGDPLFVLVLSAAIWVRRFGAGAGRIGTLVALPFIAVLVVPAPPQSGHVFVPFAAVVALVVALVATGVQWAARASGLLPKAKTAPTVAVAAPQASSVAATSSAGSGTSTMRPIASTRMAVQMAVTLSGAFLIGQLLFGDHWFWAVLTAYVVASGNRGRGDVLYKGIHRTVGALAGTATATALSLVAAPGHETAGAAWMSLAAIAIILALGLWLRPAGYGWWAAAMTAMLSILYELDGTAPGSVMIIRLGAIVVAGAFAVAVAWWVLPVRTGAAVRARTSTALAALTDLLVSCIRQPDAVAGHRARLDAALLGLRQLGPTLRLERTARMVGRRALHRADIIPAIEACWEPADAIAAEVERGHTLSDAHAKELGALARLVGECRRMLVGGPAPAAGMPAEGPLPDGHDAAASLRRLRHAIAVLPETLPLISRPPT